jgi:hypothetical protein
MHTSALDENADKAKELGKGKVVVVYCTAGILQICSNKNCCER